MRRKIAYNPVRDYYAVLGIDDDATLDEIRQAYRDCVRACHPDRNPDRVDWATGQLQLVNEAYDVLRQAHLRREYDRLRWPHLPHTPSPPRPQRTYRSPYSTPGADPGRPWWEQTTPYASSRRAARPRERRRAAAQAATPPLWLSISAWLRERHLGALESTWLTLVGVWRSPYAGLLSILAVLLALNIAGIVYAFINPGGLEQVANMLAAPTASVAAPSATPDRLRQLCLDPGVQIRMPVNYEPVGDMFSVFGTVTHPDMWSYVIELGYLGPTVLPDALPAEWRIVRLPPDDQSLPEPPVVDDLLAEGIDMTNRPAGFYAVRLRIILRDGKALLPCDVIVRR